MSSNPCRLFLLLLLLLTTQASAEEVGDPSRGWSAELPAGYAAPPGDGTPRKAFAWMKGDFEEGTASILVVEPLGGTIGREPLDLEVMKASTREAIAGSGFRITQTEVGVVPWRTHELEAIAMVVESPDESRVSVSTQVPLVPEALNVVVSGPTRMGSQLQADLRAFVGSLDGTTNWLDGPDGYRDDGARGVRLEEMLGFGIGVLLWVVIGAVWFVRKRRDP